MVNSRLNKTINYLEIDTISEDDENKTSADKSDDPSQKD